MQREIAQLGKAILKSRCSEQKSEKTRIKFANSVMTHKYIAAQYVKKWVRKVERIGNLNFPESARNKGFRKLKMDVAINANGTIYHMHITQSSGDKSLDDAAKRIVRLSAPFAPLPQELLNELDVLIITRIWGLSDDTKIPPKNIIRKTPRKDINWWIYNRNRLKNN